MRLSDLEKLHHNDMIMSDPPIISVDKLYLSQRGELSLELVCSAPANPPARLGWSRLEPITGHWVEIGEERRGNTDVWIVNRQVSSCPLAGSFSPENYDKDIIGKLFPSPLIIWFRWTVRRGRVWW